MLGLADVLPQQLLLVVDDLLQAFQLLLFGLVTLHRTVMDATHADGEHVVLRLADLLKPFRPVLLYGLAVVAVVKASALADIPFTDIVTKQWLAVTGADDDAARIGYCLGTGSLEESLGAAVHGRPYGIGA